MTSPLEIRNLALQRLTEAQILAEKGMFDGAFYLAGYSVELMLKARISERWGIPNLFDDLRLDGDQFRGIFEVRKAVRTHNLFILLVYSGLKSKFEIEKASQSKLAKANSLLFNGWDESVRYKPCGYMQEEDVNQIINVLTGPENLLTWIDSN